MTRTGHQTLLIVVITSLLAVGAWGCGADDGGDQSDRAAERAAEREERRAEREARQARREARQRRRDRRLEREAQEAAEAEAAESASQEPEEQGCTPGYTPCLPSASDYDCKDGTGDGPEYTGEVSVDHSYGDPYGLDRDKDGVGCEGQMPPGLVR